MPNIFSRVGCFSHFLRIQLLMWRKLYIHLHLQQVIQRDPCSVTIRIPHVAFVTTPVSLFTTDTLVSKPWSYSSVLHLYSFIISRLLYRIMEYVTCGVVFSFTQCAFIGVFETFFSFQAQWGKVGFPHGCSFSVGFLIDPGPARCCH